MTDNANDQVKEHTDYLLKHFRQSGVFKCFECLYCKRIDKGDIGNYYKCVHDGVAVSSFEKDEWDVMRGCACSRFEPKGYAGEAVALRQAKISETIRELADFANGFLPNNYPANWTADEKRFNRILEHLREQGIHA